MSIAQPITETEREQHREGLSHDITNHILEMRKQAVDGYLNRSYGAEGAAVITAAYQTDLSLVNHFWKDVTRLDPNLEIPARRQKLEAMIAILTPEGAVAQIKEHGFETATAPAAHVDAAERGEIVRDGWSNAR
jgi:hypothetical protein